MPKVLNKRNLISIPSDAVYVGRPSLFGNPYTIGKDGNRDEVITKFRKHFYSSGTLMDAARRYLKGKDLVCWCAPQACHADILLEYANREDH